MNSCFTGGSTWTSSATRAHVVGATERPRLPTRSHRARARRLRGRELPDDSPAGDDGPDGPARTLHLRPARLARPPPLRLPPACGRRGRDHRRGRRPAGRVHRDLPQLGLRRPPLLSFTIATGASSWPVIRDSEHLGVHILGEHQKELAGLFARSGADRFGSGTDWATGPYGVPVLDGVLAWLVCRVVARVPAGEHRVIIAEAVVGDPAGEGRPLLYHQGRFNALRD